MRTLAAEATVLLLCVDAVVLAWMEMAWLSLRVGVVPMPISVLVALVTTPLLALAARAVRPGVGSVLVGLATTPTAIVLRAVRSGVSGFEPVAVWTVTVVLCGLWSPSGPGVMPVDWRAILLVAAGLLPGVIVVAKSPRPEDRAPDERAPDERAPDERAPDERAPDERAPDERAQQDARPEGRPSTPAAEGAPRPGGSTRP